ncbi:MAG: A/G-specific adenine glycosylase [Thermoflavifilum sp.]|nr:A/G-specific adenine glycosylase [Thermoflavifilum sp.]MCL6514172.1 A/G-specific adenine glycosylase [Alicyclobacillus sp.]
MTAPSATPVPTGSMNEAGARLVAWYDRHRRALPWRDTSDPYRIWVSEVMLQQTRVETVIPYYHAFLERFPTVHALAAADSDDVLRLWQGLGYYRRARHLHEAAQQLVRQWDGRFPADIRAFRRLPGVGDYTAGAVYSIAFGEPVPAIDGNVARVFARWLGIEEPMDKPAVRKSVEAVIRQWQQAFGPSRVTQAVMELGATVCMPRLWRCDDCPLAAECEARRGQRQGDLPVRRARGARPVMDVLALLVHGGGRVLLVRRPAEGLLADMWQLPAVERPRAESAPSPTDDELLAWGREAFGAWGCDGLRVLGRARHEFTHRVWDVTLLEASQWSPQAVRELERTWVAAAWAAPDEWPRYPLARVYERLLHLWLHPAKSADSQVNRV